jgi:hypothetical protein
VADASRKTMENDKDWDAVWDSFRVDGVGTTTPLYDPHDRALTPQHRPSSDVLRTRKLARVERLRARLVEFKAPHEGAAPEEASLEELTKLERRLELVIRQWMFGNEAVASE